MAQLRDAYLGHRRLRGHHVPQRRGRREGCKGRVHAAERRGLRSLPSLTASPEPGRLLFIGSFRHLPNLLALEFFLKEVWPRLGPGFSLHVIAGANPEYYLDFYRQRVTVDLSQPGIELEGFVSDVRRAYEQAEIVLAPLTASAGTNIKVLEAMAMGRAVVSTPAGVNGLDLSPGEDVVVEAGPERFAAAIRALRDDSARRRRVEEHARATALRFDWASIGEQQRALYEQA